MRTSKVLCKIILVLAVLMPFAAAQAASGDDEAVAKARMDYEQAMKGHDVGLQNAMKIQLSVQISKARAAKKDDSASASKFDSKNNV